MRRRSQDARRLTRGARLRYDGFTRSTTEGTSCAASAAGSTRRIARPPAKSRAAPPDLHPQVGRSARSSPSCTATTRSTRRSGQRRMRAASPTVISARSSPSTAARSSHFRCAVTSRRCSGLRRLGRASAHDRQDTRPGRSGPTSIGCLRLLRMPYVHNAAPEASHSRVPALGLGRSAWRPHGPNSRCRKALRKSPAESHLARVCSSHDQLSSTDRPSVNVRRAASMIASFVHAPPSAV